MRRAIYHGRHALQFEGLFFNKVTDFVVEHMRDAYPELEASREFIERMVKLLDSWPNLNEFKHTSIRR